MKLSEAMQLASTLGENPTNDSWDTCLLGISCHAIGIKRGYWEAITRWPWLNHEFSHPQVLSGHCHRGTTILTRLCRQVVDGELTVYQASEIIREIEPSEPAVGEAQNEQTVQHEEIEA